MELEPSEVARMLGAHVQPPEGELRPYLVRGVAYSSRPAWIDVWVNRKTGSARTVQASYTGEIVPHIMLAPCEFPVVVYLHQPPSEVYVSAFLGGDAIFRGRESDAAPLGELGTPSAE